MQPVINNKGKRMKELVGKHANEQRTHDRIYLFESRRDNPKEIHKVLVELARPAVEACGERCRILDIGCARGDFLHLVKHSFPGVSLTGIDVMPDLLKVARKELPDVKFILADINGGIGLPSEKFDLVFMNSVHAIFDDHRPWVDNILGLLGAHGKAYVFGIFNPEPLDVFIKCRGAGREDQPLEKGWNLFSKDTIGRYLKKRKIEYHFQDWEITIPIERHPDDPLRSWTFKDADGRYIVQNGLQLIHTQAVLTMEHPCRRRSKLKRLV